MEDNKYTTKEQIELLKSEIQKARTNKTSRKKIKAFRFLLFLVVFILLFNTLISVLLSKNSGETPDVLGYQLYTIQSASMSPTFPIGSIILSKKLSDASALKVGDIVTFSRDGIIVTHRIIEIVNDNGIKYRTKGDNPNNSPDIDLLSPENVKAIFLLKLY